MGSIELRAATNATDARPFGGDLAATVHEVAGVTDD
jgi:hypothetical protein